jgi:hypothetical protein
MILMRRRFGLADHQRDAVDQQHDVEPLRVRLVLLEG